MDKRYQVFVSSTFRDLQEERSYVIQALLELDCIPSGMELFPAADEDQWSYIQQIIDDCDYYVVVLAGKYGSISPLTGKSYTQMEYEYAVAKGKPVIAFLHGDLNTLPMERCEPDKDKREMLEQFRAQTQTKLCKHWLNSDQLGGLVSRSMVQLMKRSPAVGWVRADRVTDESALQEIVRLRHRIEELEEQLESQGAISMASLGFTSDELAQGDTYFNLRFVYHQVEELRDGEESFEGEKRKTALIALTWNEIFTTLAPELINEVPETRVRTLVGELSFLRKPSWRDRYDIRDISVTESDFQTIKAQMRVLGLIEVSEGEGAFSGRSWRLTPRGDAYVLKAKAVKRRQPDSQD
jgi:hypothetical protein